MERMGMPVMVDGERPSSGPRKLQRMPLREGVDEAWLQELIDACPSILPISEVDPRVKGRLFSMGREVLTPAGPIDNLLVSESGHIVLVETKLWRNPEARRKVVAQVLDYAGHVRKWTYSRIAELWAGRSGEDSPMWEALDVAEDEASWVDLVENNLEAGRMTLLVVGDGIESKAETLAHTISGTPDFQFRLALVELRLFEAANGEVLVIPNTLARTREIERATVRVLYEEAPAPRVEVDVPTPSSTGTSARESRTTLDASSFLASLEEAGDEGKRAARVSERILAAIDEHPELVIEWKSAGFTVKTPDPIVEGSMMSLAVVNRPNVLYTYWEWLESQVARGWDDDDVARLLGHRLRDAFIGLGGRVTPSGRQVSLKVTSMDGREREFVDTLAALVEVIAKEAQQR